VNQEIINRVIVSAKIRKPQINSQEETTHVVTDNDSADSTPDTSTYIENQLLNCIGLKQADELIGKCYDSINPMNYKVGNSERAQDGVVFLSVHQPIDESDGGTSESH
jgi:hypothetical protein